jgi:hypothetical protein
LVNEERENVPLENQSCVLELIVFVSICRNSAWRNLILLGQVSSWIEWGIDKLENNLNLTGHLMKAEHSQNRAILEKG